jgi:hypothetical protein
VDGTGGGFYDRSQEILISWREKSYTDLHVRRMLMFGALLLTDFCTAWTPAPCPHLRSHPHLQSSPHHLARAPPPVCYSDDTIDELVLYGDAGVLLIFGTVQAFFDGLMAPLASSPTGLFVPVTAAALQGVVLAALWVGITLALRGYRPSATRTLPSRDAIVPLAAAWLGSSAVMLFAFASLGLRLDVECEFLTGCSACMAGWRWLYSQGMPLL